MFKNLTKFLSGVNINFIQANNSIPSIAKFSSFIPKWPEISDELLLSYKRKNVNTSPHHNNPNFEQLLKDKLCSFPPYQERYIRRGFVNARTLRDYKKRKVSAHFEPLRTRLLALYRNKIMPESIKKRSYDELNSLPKDAHWTRVNAFCVMSGRRRGCKSRWAISRIMWRLLADYNKMSGTLDGKYKFRTEAERKYLVWPPPPDLPVIDYLKRYHDNIDDAPKNGLTYGVANLSLSKDK